MSAIQSPHGSRHRRSKKAACVEEVTASEEEEVHFHVPALPTEEACHVMPRNDTSEAKSSAGALPLAPAPAAASPCAKKSRDCARPTRGHPRQCLTVSTSDSADSGVVLRSSDRAPPRSVRGSRAGSEHASGSSGVSPVKAGSTPMCATAPEEGADTTSQHRTSLAEDGDGDGLVFELYRPNELHRAEAGASRESPLPPAVLALRLPTQGMPGRSGTTSAGSREQAAVGRYALLSHSSRLEEVRRLPPRTSSAGGDFSGEAASGAGAMATQDDMVRNSTVDSFSADGAGAALNGSSQPQLMDSSMNSQFFLKSKQRHHSHHHTTSTSNGVNRYGSLGSPRPSQLISADTAAPALLNYSGPHLLSSDQIVVATHTRTHAAMRHSGVQQVTQQRSGEVAAPPGDAAAVAATSSLSQSDGFDLVRAPITGLRAKVLGNNAVEEEEAAEDPEMRALQAEQLKNFYSKVLKQHRSGGGGEQAAAQNPAFLVAPVPAESSAGPSPAPVPTVTKDAPATHDAALRSARKDDAADGDAAARKGPKKMKKVRFNMEGVEHRRAEPGAAPLPHHGTPQPAGALTHRALSPLHLQGNQPVQESGVSASGGEAPEESCDHVNWQSPPPPTSLRLALRAGAAQPALWSVTSATASDVLVGSSDDIAASRALQLMTPLRTPASPSASYTPRRALEEEQEQEGEASEQRLATPLTPARAGQPGPCAPPFLRQSTLRASVPLPQPPATQTPCSASPSPTAAAAAPRKRRNAAGTPHKTNTRKHRKAAVALVAGADDPIVVARASGSSSVQGTRVSHAGSNASTVLTSTEVQLVGEGDPGPGKGRKHTRPPVPCLQSLSSPRVQGQSPSPRSSLESLDAPVHRISAPRTTPQAPSPASLFCVPASLRSMQVVPETAAPALRALLSPISAPVVSGLAEEAPSPRLKERREGVEKRAKVRVLQPTPEVPSTPVKADLPRLPGEAATRPLAAVDVGTRTLSVCLDEAPVLLPPFLSRPVGVQDSVSSMSVQPRSPCCASAPRERRFSESNHSRASLPQVEPEAHGTPPATRSPLQVLPNLLASSSSRKS